MALLGGGGRGGFMSTQSMHTPNEDASIQTSAGYLSKEIGSGVAGGGGERGVHEHPVHAYSK